MKTIKIPLHKPFFGKEEKKAILEVLEAGDIGSGGNAEKTFIKTFKDYLKVNYVIPTPSGTAALELAGASLDLHEDDEVIIPSFTYPSDATAVLLQKAKVVFSDIDPVYFNLDPKEIEKQLTPKTKAIVVVHYAGMSCPMEEIIKIAKKHSLKIIEDAAHAWGSKYKNRFLGTIGDAGCFSLHTIKNITTGEGGVFITNDSETFNRAQIYSQVGTNRYQFLQGKVKQYSWQAIGSSYYLSGFQSGVAVAQLKKLKNINEKRAQVASWYFELLNGVNGLTLPGVPKHCEPNWHIFAILVKNNNRDSLMKYLKSKGIETAFHFIPLHASPMGKKLGYRFSDFRVTNNVASSILRLPIYPDLTFVDVKHITEEIIKFFNHIVGALTVPSAVEGRDAPVTIL